MTQIQAIVWDFDGTLIDSEPVWLAAEADIIHELGAQVPPNYAELTVGGTVLRTAQVMVDVTGTDLTAAEMADWLVADMVRRLSSEPIAWRPGVPEALAVIAADGIRQAICSASYRPILDAVLNRVDTQFDVIVSGDQITHGKPHPESYQRVCTELGVAPTEVLVIEDSTNGCAAANAAGCPVLAVPSVVIPPPRPRRVFRDSLVDIDLAALTSIFQEASA